MTGQDALDDLFRQGVSAIDAGDVPALETLLAAHPELAGARLDSPGSWLRDRIGNAVDGFFARPYLLWFVAEDPVRTGHLPSNIVAIADSIVRAVRAHAPDSLQVQLDYALSLVSWSGVAATCVVQIPLIDALVGAGASPGGNPNNALVNGHLAAAERLVHWGAPLTLGAALCLERWDDVPRLAGEATKEQRQFALVLAALNGKSRGVKWLLDAGAPVNEPSAHLYSHGTPLHHAVCSGSLDTVRVLVDAGANVQAADSAWHGTPLGWACHYVESAAPDRRGRYAEIVAYLRGLEPANQAPPS